MFGFKHNNSTDAPVASRPVPPSQLPGTGDELESLWEPTQAREARKSVEQILLERGHVSDDQLLQARNVQSQTPGKSLAQVLQTMNVCTESHILCALAETLGLAVESPTKAVIEQEAFALLHPEY